MIARRQVNALSSALREAGLAWAVPGVRAAAPVGVPCAVQGPQGQSLVVRYAVDKREGPSGSLVAETTDDVGRRKVVATEAGPVDAREVSTRMRSRSVRLPDWLWDALDDASPRNTSAAIRAACEQWVSDR